MFWKRYRIDEAAIHDALDGFDAFRGCARTVLIQNGHILITLEIDPAQARAMEDIAQQAEEKIGSLRGAASVRIILTAEREARAPATPSGPHKNAPVSLPNVKHIIAVASGKGGVGKSTVAANLAVAMSKQGLRVGLLDADIYGPSVPMLFGLRGKRPSQSDDGKIVPLQAHGVTVMSIGFMIADDSPAVWRGPMVQSAILQLLRDVQWGTLDVLLLDMPPGTGDAQLTVAQKVPLSGAVIVSTPQDIALLDSIKGIDMFRKVDVPVLGIVENMSLYCCPECGHQSAIFGTGGAEARAKEMNVPFLGRLALDPALRIASDNGTPLAGSEFGAIATKIITKLTSPLVGEV